jgi:hypothetical protein
MQKSYTGYLVTMLIFQDLIPDIIPKSEMSYEHGFDSQQLQRYGYLKIQYMPAGVDIFTDKPVSIVLQPANVCCSIISGLLTGPYIFLKHLTGDALYFFNMNCWPSKRIFLCEHNSTIQDVTFEVSMAVKIQVGCNAR